MSISVNATFNLPIEQFQSLIPCIQQPIIIDYTEREETLHLYLIRLYLHCHKNQVEKSILKELWQCINSLQLIPSTISFFQSVNNQVIVDFLKSKNEKVFASIIEDDDFYTKLIDYIVNTTVIAISNEEDEMEHGDQKEVDDVINSYKSSSLGVLDMLNDDKFDEFLVKMGINEEGRKDARAIKEEMKESGKPDMNKVMAFIQKYKQNFDSSNIDLNTLYSMMTGAADVKEKPQLPFDLNNMMSMINNLSSSFTQPQKSRRGGRRR